MSQNKLSLNQVTTWQMLGLIVLAYVFSFAIRMIWVWQFQDNPNFFWNDQLMINTNDGYFFASGVQKELFGLHETNPRVFGIWDYGIIFFTTLFVKITPFSLETVILYLPSVISSLVVIPIIMIARLYGQSLWGFFAALLGSLAWSYYNRTMTGYYDTDMFSAMAPMFILFFLMKSTIDFNFRSSLYAAIAISIYPFLYDGGLSLVYAMGIIYAVYMIFYHRNENMTYLSLILIFVSLLPFPFVSPFEYLIKIVVLIILYITLQKTSIPQKNLMIISSILFVSFLYFGNVFSLVLSKVSTYLSRGLNNEVVVLIVPNIILMAITLMIVFLILKVLKIEKLMIIRILSGVAIVMIILGIIYSTYMTVLISALFGHFLGDDSLSGLYFYSVVQTVREAGQIPFSMFANRISGSEVGVILSLIGYVVLVIRQRAFILALPLVGIGIFALFGGLRFTVYAVPIAAMSVIYLFFVWGDFFKDKKFKYAFIIFATAVMLYPNIAHILDYKVPTVLNKAEVEDLVKLDSIANPKDYTLSWWDYGYPIWYYSDTSTIIDGGKHSNDNFIISKIMQTSSAELAANLSRLSVEIYVDSNYSTITSVMFKNKQKDQRDPNLFLSELEDPNYKLPKKTRDIYLYFPYRMMRIFPTVSVFGNLDLTTGQAERKISFYPTQAVRNENGMITLRNGIIFNAQKGEITLGKQKKNVKNFIITQNTKEGKVQLQSQLYHANGEYAIVYMKSYGQFVVMDTETFNSMYVQMFILEKYDHDLFELVVSSPYSKIYKLKK